MINMEPAHTDQQFEELLEMVYHQKTTYLNPILDLIELTWEQFGSYFRSTGTIYRICQSGSLLGLCWVATSQNIMQLLGLIVKPEHQGQGIGTQALEWLESNRPEAIRGIELLVHISNPRAKTLYQRRGYQETAFNRESGFYTMRKMFDQ